MTSQERTIAYLEHKLTHELPEHMERVEQVLGRLTLQHRGQMQFDFEGDDHVADD